MKKRGRNAGKISKAKLAERFNIALNNFLEDYERLNPRWFERVAATHIYASVYTLFASLRDEKDTEVTWGLPVVELFFPVQIDWEHFPSHPRKFFGVGEEGVPEETVVKEFINQAQHTQTSLFLEAVTRHVVWVETAPPREPEGIPCSVEDLLALQMKKRVDLTEEQQRTLEEATRAIEEDIARQEEEDTGYFLVPPDLQKELEGLSEEEQFDRISELSTFTTSLALPLSEDGTGGDSIEIGISPLVVNTATKEATYRTFVGLNLHSLDPEEDMTAAQRDEFLDAILEGLRRSIPPERIPRRLRVEVEYDEATFAFPSHAVMWTLLALFSGRPQHIPRKVLEKRLEERTSEEQQEAEDFIARILEPPQETLDERGGIIREKRRIAVLSDNPAVQAKAQIDADLFSDDLHFQEGQLAAHLKSAFGARGLKHLFGLLIALDENFREGVIDWDVNEHLERLGKRRGANRAFKPEDRQEALDILRIFTSLFITSVKKDGENVEEMTGMRLFLPEGFTVKSVKNWVVSEKVRIRATSLWYRDAFEDRGQGKQYTKLLKKLAKENSREHATTLLLAPLLAMSWRMKTTRPLTVKSLLTWCNIPKDNKLRNSLRSLEAELEYMKENGYLGDWAVASGTLPSQSDDPEAETISFTPPAWLERELAALREGQEARRLRQGKHANMTKEELADIVEQSGLTAAQFAKTLGKSPSTISRIRSGERSLTPDIEALVREKFPHLLPPEEDVLQVDDALESEELEEDIRDAREAMKGATVLRQPKERKR